jgi:hypothetical protein
MSTITFHLPVSGLREAIETTSRSLCSLLAIKPASLHGRIQNPLVRCAFLQELLLKLPFSDDALFDEQLCRSVGRSQSGNHQLL